MNIRMVGMLSAGHLANDLNQGAIAALLPFLITQNGLSYTAATGIVFAFTLTSTMVQPLFGYLADRLSYKWIIPAALFLASGGFAMIGFAPSYLALITTVVLCGIGSAAFHPEAARYINFAGGMKKATAMSIFGVGGSLGFALGPLLITTSVLHWGLQGSIVMLVPASLTILLMLTQSSSFESLGDIENVAIPHIESVPKEDNWDAFLKLTLTIVGKSIVFYGLITFIPLYWVEVLNQSETAGAAALTVFSMSGVIGTLLGGKLADRFGHVKIIILGCVCLTPCLPALAWFGNVHITTLLLIPTGAFLLMTYGPTIVSGQRYLPNHIGFSSGMTLGVAFSIGGLVAPLLGSIADHYGLWFVLASIAVIPFLILPIVFTLPDTEI